MVSGEKRNCEEENDLGRITTILLDIEGTTTSISFVKDTLFPYVKENLKSYIDSHWDDEEFKADLKALKEQAKKDEEEKLDGFCLIEEGEKEKETVINNILWQMNLDRKTTALKQLQGHIWREGYESGKLKGHLYSEVAPTFKKWNEEGRKLYIFSSGSVEAQKLLFKNSENGDLQDFLSGYFDTETGPKTEASSYTNIAKSIGCDCNQILFLTDVVKEAVAADKAGMQVMIVIRNDNSPLTDDEKKAFTTITNFKDIVFESSNKKKKISEEEFVSKKPAETAAEKEETADTKNGDTNLMEVETNETNKEDCNQENKTEENDQDKTELITKTPETESENIEVDIDDSNVESGAEEKVVSSSVDDNEHIEEKTDEEKGKAEETIKKEENVDSTNDSATLDTNKEDVKELPQESDNSKLNDTEEKEAKSINGHDNCDRAENGEVTEEIIKEKNENHGEEAESVPVKKVSAEEQADSTVEVTA